MRVSKNQHEIQLGNLFDFQIKTLKYRCPQMIIEAFKEQRNEVIEKALSMNISKGNIPFILVISQNYINIYGLMNMLRNYDLGHYTFINSEEIAHDVEISEKSYVIYDVENGSETLNKSPKEAKEFIENKNRFCLMVDESIALCLHSKVLFDHNVDCAGSRCNHAGKVVSIYLNNGKPDFCWCGNDNEDIKYGSPSCGSRG
jgi:hypothetical protein